MKLGLLWLLVEKARKIYIYEQCPRTEEQYIKLRDKIQNEISEIEKEYADNRDSKLKKKLKKLKERLRYYIISPLEYEVCKKTLEEYKKAYINEIPEEDWNYNGLLEIYLSQYGKKWKRKYEKT